MSDRAIEMQVDIPLEIQYEIFAHLAYQSPSSLASVLRLSKTHQRLAESLLYKHIAVRNRTCLGILSRTFQRRPELARHAQTFFFRGPQTRRVTGEDALTLLADEDGEIDVQKDDEALGVSRLDLEEIQEMQRLGLEPGVEGAGQEATWDEHEATMQLCTNILRACSPTLRSVGFVDCVPWFLAPSEGGTLSFPLPKCQEFTGVTIGLFGLLPHLQRNGQHTDSPGQGQPTFTSLGRIHLIGADLGSFALQRVLQASPTAKTLTHLHVTAPPLYRSEHRSHLVKHIQNLLETLPALQRLSVGIVQWHPPPPSNFSRSKEAARPDDAPRDIVDDDRLSRCREAYMSALPEALTQSLRTDVLVALVQIPFAQGSPAGFGGWIMKHHRTNVFVTDESCLDATKADPYRKVWMNLWKRRNLRMLPDRLSMDGAPMDSVWQLPAQFSWRFTLADGLQSCDDGMESR